MSSVVISGDTSGAITLAAPSVAGTNTATLPAATGTVMVSGNQPAFVAYQSSGQSITNNVFVKVQLQSKLYDTASAFDNTTNYRFTPQVAGYYQLNGIVQFGNLTSSSNWAVCQIRKNGSSIIYGSNFVGCGNGINVTLGGLVYMNGSSDYVELYVYQNSAGAATVATGYDTTLFSGCLTRTA